MWYCDQCDKYFNKYNGYTQHVQNSAAHQSKPWECEVCENRFVTEHSRHQHYSSASGHPYCIPCKRLFRNENNLTQHMHSKTHVGSNMKCPFCQKSFTTASGVTIHLESGTCSSGLDRARVNELVRRLDTQNVITRPMITLPGYDDGVVECFATERAWNGTAYQCYLCPNCFGSLPALNSHLRSPVHELDIYCCPNCGCGRTYKLLSGLVQHVESESCGLMRFMQVQQQARNGIQNMVGRMISG